MSLRHPTVRLVAKSSMVLGAIFLIALFSAALPSHHAPALAAEEPAQSAQQTDHASMPGMDMRETSTGHDMHNGHMTMTEMRPQTPDDVQRAWKIVEALRPAMEKYKDYHVALNEGFEIFLPNVPQPEYHFTKYGNGIRAAFTFDPGRPTSLLYKKTATGYDLAGAMYTMPRTATEDELNARVPLSVAMWHLHTNLCLPPSGDLPSADLTKFGFRGSITTKEACDAAGGRFHPVMFGWMVHVYPYETTLDKIFAMHMHMD